MSHRVLFAGILVPLLLSAAPVRAEAGAEVGADVGSGMEPVIWGVQAEQLEYRVGDETDVFAWDFDAFAGTDELKFVWRSVAEYAFEEDGFETLENQARLHMPVSDFFDAVAGLRVDTPDGADRVYGVVGVQGLAPQWFEIDAALFLAEDPTFRFEAEYEALITNRITLIPSLELDLPFTDDREIGAGAWGPKLEAGVRLGYDLVDRAISPYIGVHYERVFGESADLAREDGEDEDAFFFVLGARILF